MPQFFHHVSGLFWRKRKHFLLAFCWISGILSGTALHSSAGSLFTDYTRLAVLTASDTAPLWLILLPVFISGFAIFLSAPLLLFAGCFASACLFSLVSVSVLYSFGRAGWLIRWLFLFCKIAGMPVLYLYWLRSLDNVHADLSRKLVHFFLTCVLFCGIWYLDVRIITPILARLIDF